MTSSPYTYIRSRVYASGAAAARILHTVSANTGKHKELPIGANLLSVNSSPSGNTVDKLLQAERKLKSFSGKSR